MVREYINIHKIKSMMVNGDRIKKMDMVNMNQLKEHIRVIGKMIKSMEKVL